MKNGLPVRKNIRLRHYDYSSAGYYDVTICIEGKRKLFGKASDGKIHLTEYGEIAERELLKIPQHYKNVKIDKHVIMPNHVHVIIVLVGDALARPALSSGAASGAPTFGKDISNAPTIGNIVRGYKAGVSRKFGFSCWQRGYYEHVIRDETDYLKRWQFAIPLSTRLHCSQITH